MKRILMFGLPAVGMAILIADVLLPYPGIPLFVVGVAMLLILGGVGLLLAEVIKYQNSLCNENEKLREELLKRREL